ncbi:hypothetical protein [Aquibacillus saliphilus]|uniref:hypothetical protein n=1 Tax=Aquibacillus saliphilus TaxID=1909422 RepID=UPI001CF07755|nr:hypothetical protein [Aquibacillus saliphilus]
MLSDYNINKLNMSGLYGCEPNKKYRGQLFYDNLNHCCNWTFQVVKNHEGNYFMRDTYWSSGDSLSIPLSDENIDEFRLIFEWVKVRKIRLEETNHYENHYRVAVDSGGYSFPKYFVDIDRIKNKEMMVDEIDSKIKSLEWEIGSLRDRKDNLLNGTYKVDWF